MRDNGSGIFAESLDKNAEERDTKTYSADESSAGEIKKSRPPLHERLLSPSRLRFHEARETLTVTCALAIIRRISYVG